MAATIQPIAVAAKRPGLTQALDRSRNKCRSTSVRPSWWLFFTRLTQAFDPRHKLRAGKSAGTPFLGSAFQTEIIGSPWPNGLRRQIVGSRLGSGQGSRQKQRLAPV